MGRIRFVRHNSHIAPEAAVVVGVVRGAAPVPEADGHLLAGPGREVGLAVRPGEGFHQTRIDFGGEAVPVHDEDLVVRAVAAALARPERGTDRGRETEGEPIGLRQRYRDVAPAEAAARAPRRLVEEAKAQVAVRREPASVEEGAGFEVFRDRLRCGAGHLGEGRAGKEREAKGIYAGQSLRIRTRCAGRSLCFRMHACGDRGLEDRDRVEWVSAGESECGVDGVERRKDAPLFGNGGGEEGVGGMRRDCAGQSLRIRTRTRDLNLPVVAHPNAQVAGDGRGGGVGDVEAYLEGRGGVALRGEDDLGVVWLPLGTARSSFVKADEARCHAVACVFRREEGKRGKRGKKRRRNKCGKEL